jgi:hypothetical protein
LTQWAKARSPLISPVLIRTKVALAEETWHPLREMFTPRSQRLFITVPALY